MGDKPDFGLIGGIVGFIIACCIAYGIIVFMKNVSYTFFYESNVQETIREMVKPEYLLEK